jgi:hypothetical protein
MEVYNCYSLFHLNNLNIPFGRTSTMIHELVEYVSLVQIHYEKTFTCLNTEQKCPQWNT